MQITQEQLQEVKKIDSTLSDMRFAISELEIQKVKIVGQFQSARNRMEAQAEEYLIAAGIPQDEVKTYRINLATGEIVKKEQPPQV